MNTQYKLMIGLSAALAMSACTGGPAGDSDADPNAVIAVSQFQGLYQLPDNWEGTLSRDALFDIAQPDESGTAVATLLFQDIDENCLESSVSTGEVSLDPFTNAVFLDGFFLQFPSATLNLQGSTLSINLIEDVSDIDNDGIENEPATITALSIGMMVTDFGTCT